MDDKEKLAMLESEKIRLQNKVNQQNTLIEKAVKLLQAVQDNNDKIMKEWEATIKYINTSYLLGILTGVSLLMALQGLIAIFLN